MLSALNTGHQRRGAGITNVLSLFELIQSWQEAQGVGSPGIHIHPSHTSLEEATGRDPDWVDQRWLDSRDRFMHLTKRAPLWGGDVFEFHFTPTKAFFQGGEFHQQG